jgi:hypothetical protein
MAKSIIIVGEDGETLYQVSEEQLQAYALKPGDPSYEAAKALVDQGVVHARVSPDQSKEFEVAGIMFDLFNPGGTDSNGGDQSA